MPGRATVPKPRFVRRSHVPASAAGAAVGRRENADEVSFATSHALVCVATLDGSS